MSAQSPCMHPQTVPRALPPETTNHAETLPSPDGETFGPRILPARTPVTPPTLNLNQHLAIFFSFRLQQRLLLRVSGFHSAISIVAPSLPPS